MPTYDIYRETRCRERYYVNAETPEEALAKFEAGGEDIVLRDDEVMDADPPQVCLDGIIVLDRATS